MDKEKDFITVLIQIVIAGAITLFFIWVILN